MLQHLLYIAVWYGTVLDSAGGHPVHLVLDELDFALASSHVDYQSRGEHCKEIQSGLRLVFRRFCYQDHTGASGRSFDPEEKKVL